MQFNYPLLNILILNKRGAQNSALELCSLQKNPAVSASCLIFRLAAAVPLAPKARPGSG